MRETTPIAERVSTTTSYHRNISAQSSNTSEVYMMPPPTHVIASKKALHHALAPGTLFPSMNPRKLQEASPVFILRAVFLAMRLVLANCTCSPSTRATSNGVVGCQLRVDEPAASIPRAVNAFVSRYRVFGIFLHVSPP